MISYLLIENSIDTYICDIHKPSDQDLFYSLYAVLFFYLRDDKSYVSDATAAILVIFSMFLFPSVRPEMFGGKRATGKDDFQVYSRVSKEQSPLVKVIVPGISQ